MIITQFHPITANIVTDAITAVQNFFKDMLSDAIISALNTVNDLITGSLNATEINDEGETVTTGINGIFSEYLGNPADFSGGSGSALWDSIKKLSDNAIVPIGGFILIIIMCYELYDLVLEKNNFHDVDTSFFIRWVLKCICGIYLLSNVTDIALTFFTLGTRATNAGINTFFGSGGGMVDSDLLSGDAFKTELMTQGIGTLLITLIISFVIIIATFILLVAIIIVLAQRVIEVMMYMAIAPIPMASMLNRDWGEMGKNWIRNVLALAFQGFFIIVALFIFQALLNNALKSMISGTTGDVILTMSTTLGFVVALIFTMFRTSAISKSIFGAH